MMILMRNILLWLSLVVMHLHAIMPHEHRHHNHQQLPHIHDITTDQKPISLYSILLQIFSFDIGENHLDNFKDSQDGVSDFTFLPLIREFEIPLSEFLPFYDDAGFSHLDVFIPRTFLFDSRILRGPPALI